MSDKVDHDVWENGGCIAYASPIGSGVTYKYADSLCERMHKIEPDVKFDNREWLGRAHYILYHGDYDRALAAVKKIFAEEKIILECDKTEEQRKQDIEDSWDDKKVNQRPSSWHLCAPGTVSAVQAWSKVRKANDED